MSVSPACPPVSRTRADGRVPVSPPFKGDADTPLQGAKSQRKRVPASEQLTAALVRLAADGGRVPCGERGSHHLWTSEDQAERMLAVVLCAGCPLLEVCGRAGEEGSEVGVWGGRDLGVKPRVLRPRVAK